jgi:hypothetical protein
MWTPDLIPVDQYIKTLQKKIDDTIWEDTNANTDPLDRELAYFLKLQAKGELYEPMF